ncbi:hypothetical protein A7317_12835 [Pseudomonas fluorescens]|uniref:Uncharacterized protein n=1 Tax=Pseudomonas gorinensis TaxID=3240790 RepID=A0ACA7P7Z6_9PSED|nr:MULTISPECIES: hypothetical protein [Pseudomonas]AHC35789.1 hypothetical protein U771_16352 [Pseudomonas sp. TKP]AOE67850.1 hypothetical protein A7317_12835 [Pseudomonas fluorescens]AOE73661.1 hypothetical protein A7319_12800 [Pseudomonas fluorescens]MDR6576574.1 hypothetical protein [Pseudomonas extremaustralis]PMX18773.1 hypothetical protein C1Y25_01460 [Pseudomonas sp. MPBC4-3]
MRLSIFRVNSVQQYRHFALLDTQGRCIAFKSCEGTPQNGEWVQVNEVNLAWLYKALPAHALARSNTRTL